ncbi:zonular occludens toxin domain-containing protein [Wielerella bovis]|uniref:zonular occludens toxin domain-containing protein n=1 Tax=Wielerella bovis TaxID=2917790 RepID=UPI002019B9CD|nr:zonular occludens toxin domain-containing protein [Wielerella bovis]ULJ60619.1 zonular occludens toxin domain-containing protein [Wielerella bovis]ULJ60629.1 zonular occludens toxin domain-containing protein [Wielerella bovis]
MIYLITGTPGTGKTSMVVDMMLTNYEGLFKMTLEDGTEIDRPLYFCHIDGLDARKFKAHELTEEELQSKPLNELVPQGSVVIVDECDYTYPVRSAAREVPPYVKTLKELRHDGFTLILMTQHPAMIDKYVRQLVGKHIHLERKQLGTKRYEWYQCEEGLNGSKEVGVFYKPSKEAFKYYKSASQHIEFKKKLHWVFYALPLIIILFFYLIYKAYAGIVLKQNKPTTDTAVEQTAVSSVASAPVVLPAISASNPAETMQQEKPPVGSQLSDYQPRIPSLPETKPLYDGLRQPINMETVAGCVKSAKSCNCYTEQATKVYVSAEMCKHWAENGVFQVYKNMNSVAVNTPVSGQ